MTLAALMVSALTLGSSTAHAQGEPGPTTSTPPSTFGPTWDDPRTAVPPVPVPRTRKCSVTLVNHEFRNWDVLKADYAPPANCRGPWAKVVLHLDGKVAGRQYDRLGWVDVNGVRLLTTSTPEPSAEGISWHVEKDITAQQAVLRSAGTTEMFLGNTVNETYTGVLDVTVRLDFYMAERSVKVPDVADQVIPLTEAQRVQGDLVGRVSIPRSTEKLIADVYATGSGGGCEEFWDLSTPAETGYSCADGLPYREVNLYIDGQLAGVALPMAYVYTGGWSNPFLWYNIPSPGAFDIRALTYDLTPFIGLLNDGKDHELRVTVVGGPEDGSGWTLSPSLRAWTDHLNRPLKAGLNSVTSPSAAITSTVEGQPGTAGSVDMKASRSFTAEGWVETARGRVVTTVTRSLANQSHHTWTQGEGVDTLTATWSDREVVTSREKNRKPSITDTQRQWSKDGELSFLPHTSIADAHDVTTTLDIAESATIRRTVFGHSLVPVTTSQKFDGTASWLYGVPREQRVATARASEVYSTTGDPELGCYRHSLVAVNGFFTEDAVTRTC